MEIVKEMEFTVSHKFENNTTQIPEFWPNSGSWRQTLMEKGYQLFKTVNI